MRFSGQSFAPLADCISCERLHNQLGAAPACLESCFPCFLQCRIRNYDPLTRDGNRRIGDLRESPGRFRDAVQLTVKPVDVGVLKSYEDVVEIRNFGRIGVSEFEFQVLDGRCHEPEQRIVFPDTTSTVQMRV